MTLQISALQSYTSDSVHLRGSWQGGEDLERVIRQIRMELVTLRDRQAAVSKRIATIRTAITSLAEIFGEKAIPEELQSLLSHPRQRLRQGHPGLTELCRTLLRESCRPLTLPEMLQQILERRPMVLAHHKNPRVSLGVVLKRLVDYSEAERVLSTEGLRAWRWRSGNLVEATDSSLPPSE